MKQAIQDFLCCPKCKDELSAEIRRRNHHDIQSGGLLCDCCSEEYPIVSDRPILMARNAIHSWLSPIDEALNPSEIRRPEGPLSILRLKRLGIEEAVGRTASQSRKTHDDAFDMGSDLGASSMLAEIHRVLEPGGSYIAIFNKEPWVYDMIPIEQYKRFATAFDMYSGLTDLFGKAQQNHLVLSSVEEFMDNGKEICMVEFEKDGEGEVVLNNLTEPALPDEVRKTGGSFDAQAACC